MRSCCGVTGVGSLAGSVVGGLWFGTDVASISPSFSHSSVSITSFSCCCLVSFESRLMDIGWCAGIFMVWGGLEVWRDGMSM